MTWERKRETRPPEKIVAEQEFEPRHGNEWIAAVARITPEQVATKLRYFPELRRLLADSNPDSKTAFEKLAHQHGDDAVILAAVAKSLRGVAGGK